MKPAYRSAGTLPLLVATLLIEAALTGCTSTRAAAEPPVTDTASVELTRGDESWRAGRFETASWHYLKAGRLDPTSDVPLLRLGALQESLGRGDLALRFWQLAAERNPQRALTRQRLGFARLAEADPTGASAEFAQALVLDAGLWRSRFGAALASEALGDLVLAQRHLDDALLAQPLSAELLAHSARIALRLGQSVRARREAEAALALEPRDEATLVLADLQALDGDYARALESYHGVLTEAAAYERLGERALERDDPIRAVQFFDEAIVASPVHLESARQRRAIARARLDVSQRTP